MTPFLNPSKFALLAIITLLVSCQDDPALVKKREEQRIQIETLKGEIALKEQMIEMIPSDKTKELEQAKIKVEAQTEELENLEQEVAELEKKKRILDDEIKDYQKKYPIQR